MIDLGFFSLEKSLSQLFALNCLKKGSRNIYFFTRENYRYFEVNFVILR